jgi:hypothetical protein
MENNNMKKIEAAIALLDKGDQGHMEKIYYGIALILEIAEEDPNALSALERAIAKVVLKLLAAETEKNFLGPKAQAFDDDSEMDAEIKVAA